MFIVLSLFTFYLYALGYALTSQVGDRVRLCDRLGLGIAVGMLVNFALMLSGQTITRVFAAGAIVASWGVYQLLKRFKTRAPIGLRTLVVPALSFACLAYVLSLYYAEVLSEPLEHWDARSIWFFHAKMIWTEGALRQSAGWNHPSLAFSNPDYPKLVPSIAAQLGYLKGYWNEFLPKGSLLVMLVPLSLWVFSFFEKSLSFVLLLCMFFFGFGAWLWNGYMDGYVALYAGVALLLFGRYLAESRNADLYAGMCALGLAANIKNEGLLVGLCVLTAMALISVARYHTDLWSSTQRLIGNGMFVKILIISLAPMVMWAICKRAWGLQNDLAGDPMGGVTRLWNRLIDGATPQYLLQFLTVRANAIWVAAGLVAIIAALSSYRRAGLHPGAIVAASTAALYFVGIAAVYLTTPHDILPYYLLTSATRTMATASMALFIALFFLLSRVEAHAAD